MSGRQTNGLGTFKQLPPKKNGKKSWQCSIETKDQYGKRKMITASATSKAEARQKAVAKLNAYKKEILNPSTINPKQERKESFQVSFLSWLEIHAASRGWAPSSLQTRKGEFKKIFALMGDIPLENITTQTINNTFKTVVTKKNRRHMGCAYSNMRLFFIDLMQTGVLTTNPFEYAKPLPPIKIVNQKELKFSNSDQEEDTSIFDDDMQIFTDEEVQKLMDGVSLISYPTGQVAYWRLPIYIVMLLTGMRGQEVRALTLDDVDFNKHTIRINKAVTEYDSNGKHIIALKETKTSSSNRIIGINSTTESMLKRIIEHRPQGIKSKLIYPTSKGKPVGRNNFARDFRLILKGLGIEKGMRHPHSLRHTFASLALEGNKLSPLYDKSALHISQYLGHSDLSTTYRIYAHLDKQKLRDISSDDITPVLEISFPFDYDDDKN